MEDNGGGAAFHVEKCSGPLTAGGKGKSALGLGLSICRRSVEANGGVLSVRNRPGTGCVFTIELPRHAVVAEETARAL